MIGLALEEKNDKEGDSKMKQNAFDKEDVDTLTHAEMMGIIEDAKKGGSLKRRNACT